MLTVYSASAMLVKRTGPTEQPIVAMAMVPIRVMTAIVFSAGEASRPPANRI